MLRHNILFVLFWSVSEALLCFNCSSTNFDYSNCGGDFSPSGSDFNNSKHYIINCTGENALCFVRSWSARAQYSWLVQRGCYLPVDDDSVPRSLNLPTRSMTCKRERLIDAVYSVCLCQADWCNCSPKTTHFTIMKSYTRSILIFILVYILFR